MALETVQSYILQTTIHINADFSWSHLYTNSLVTYLGKEGMITEFSFHILWCDNLEERLAGFDCNSEMLVKSC